MSTIFARAAAADTDACVARRLAELHGQPAGTHRNQFVAAQHRTDAVFRCTSFDDCDTRALPQKHETLAKGVVDHVAGIDDVILGDLCADRSIRERRIEPDVPLALRHADEATQHRNVVRAGLQDLLKLIVRLESFV